MEHSNAPSGARVKGRLKVKGYFGKISNCRVESGLNLEIQDALIKFHKEEGGKKGRP